MKKICLSLLLVIICILFLGGCGDYENIKTAELEFNDSKKVEKRVVTLYFPDSESMYLEREIREIEVDESIEKSILLEVFKGPYDENMHPSISGDVKVLSVKSKSGVCTVDLSSEFAECNTGGSTREHMAIMSIVNSLCALENVEKVKINIEGETDPDFGGHFTLAEPFSPNDR